MHKKFIKVLIKVIFTITIVNGLAHEVDHKEGSIIFKEIQGLKSQLSSQKELISILEDKVLIQSQKISLMENQMRLSGDFNVGLMLYCN